MGCCRICSAPFFISLGKTLFHTFLYGHTFAKEGIGAVCSMAESEEMESRWGRSKK